ncbi:hypothetical protein GCM10007874_46170 [Labrys miyagiensis]|uniref:Uncharacterized protein n=1 Tax=Labrys miyagiensis TaxID=346912 RepID=A0ABQ6CP61_9HYPH|nr:hypothetical protein [Labrys miyagiensis]GLS21600.1 hypothetical protein GCM10007874_46170 [Labrys miyagiensis]
MPKTSSQTDLLLRKGAMALKAIGGALDSVAHALSPTTGPNAAGAFLDGAELSLKRAISLIAEADDLAPHKRLDDDHACPVTEALDYVEQKMNRS